jgi:predicted DNA-binding protein (MmcQ/YjbR family)
VAPHHVLPDSTWISFYLKQPGDVEQATALLQRSYDIVRQRAADHAEKKAHFKPWVEVEGETES